MLRASKVFHRNMRYHWDFHCSTEEVLIIGPKDTFEELNKLNLKTFHPVTTVYAVGNIVGGVAFRTARPYRIETFNQTINFVSTIVQRSKKELFGDFEFAVSLKKDETMLGLKLLMVSIGCSLKITS